MEICSGLGKQLETHYGFTNSNAAIQNYIRFLNARSKNSDHVPSIQERRVWHQHNLNTQNYCDYCIGHFGRIIFDEAGEKKQRHGGVLIRPINDTITPRIYAELNQKYQWTFEFTEILVKQYEKFIFLRARNSKLSPSDDIDKIWHQHIVHFRNYVDYCYVKFGKIVHHDPEDAKDPIAREKRLSDTAREFAHTETHNNCEHTVELRFFYNTYANGQLIGKFSPPRPENPEYKFHGKIIHVPSYIETIGELKGYIAKLINFHLLGINIYTPTEWAEEQRKGFHINFSESRERKLSTLPKNLIATCSDVSD